MGICNFILFQTTSTEFYSYFIRKLLDSDEGVILSLDNPLDAYDDKT